MIKQKTYFMLLVSAFTFFGLSTIQNISYFTDFFGDVKITINITSQEEENETSNNQEVKETKAKTASLGENEAFTHSNKLNSSDFQDHILNHKNAILEVATPPPEFFIG